MKKGKMKKRLVLARKVIESGRQYINSLERQIDDLEAEVVEVKMVSWEMMAERRGV